jgi:hypothetical protein
MVKRKKESVPYLCQGAGFSNRESIRHWDTGQDLGKKQKKKKKTVRFVSFRFV